MGRPRRTIHIDRKTESLWQENALCLVGPERCELLKPDETVNIKLSTIDRSTIDRFELFVA